MIDPPEDGMTEPVVSLRGVRADQAALHGLLQRIRDLGVSIISVTHIPSKTAH